MEARRKTRRARKVTRLKWNRDGTILLPDDFSLTMVTARSPPSKLSDIKNELRKGPGANAIEGQVFRTFLNLRTQYLQI